MGQIKLKTGHLLNRLGELHRTDPRVGVKPETYDEMVDRRKLKPEEFNFQNRKMRSFLANGEKKPAFGVGNIQRSVGLYHSEDFGAAYEGERKKLPGCSVSINTVDTRPKWMIEEQAREASYRDPWRDFGGEA